MSFSRRSDVDDAPSQLARELDQVRLTRSDCIDLTLSNPTRAGLSYDDYAEVWRSAGQTLPVYEPDALGLERARQAVAAHWPGRPDAARADRLLLLPSSSEAYDYVFTLLCDEGDSVLVPEPSYPLLAHLGRYTRVELRPYRLVYDGAWHIDLDSVRHAVSPRTRAVVLVSPNNPTGSFTSRTELAALAGLGLALVSDEVFARYELTAQPGRLHSALGASEALTFAIDGLSKSAGLPQLKLSWLGVSGPEPLVREALRRASWIADTYLPVATPVQDSLPGLLDCAVQFRSRLSSRLRQNQQTLIVALERSAASVLASEGGWYAVVRLPAVLSEESWVLGLARARSVLTHPGYFYDFESRSPHLVLSLLPDETRFAAAARALGEHVAEVVQHQSSVFST